MSSIVYPSSQNFPSDTSATEFSSKKMKEFLLHMMLWVDRILFLLDGPIYSASLLATKISDSNGR